MLLEVNNARFNHLRSPGGEVENLEIDKLRLRRIWWKYSAEGNAKFLGFVSSYSYTRDIAGKKRPAK